MKRFTAILLLACLLLCSCGKADYNKAVKKFTEKDEYSVTTHSTLTVSAEGETEVTQTVTELTLNDGMYAASVTEGENESLYHYKDGNIYVSAADGKYRWEDTEENFLATFCYAPPLDTLKDRGTETDGKTEFTAILSADDYAQTLLATNPSFSGMDAATVTFGEFTYSATVDGSKLIEYTFDFSFETEDAVKAENKLTVSVKSSADTISFPDTSDYIESASDLEDLGVSDEVFTEQVLYVIFESLYNPDGSKSENFDAYYEQFVELYGEDVMEQLVQIADMYRDPSVTE